MKSLVIDLETFGSTSNSVIASIGAVQFDPHTGKTGKEFYQRIDIQSCLDYGLEVNGSTIAWWMKQNDKARAELFKDTKPLEKVLYNFKDFYKSLGNKYVWGNSITFDCGILQDAYKATGIYLPFNSFNTMDVRTLHRLYPEARKKTEKKFKFKGEAHTPIYDCHFEIAYIKRIFKKLKLELK